MPIFTISKSKKYLSLLIKKAVAGEEIIASGNKPVARLVAFGEVNKNRKPGLLKGKLHVGPEFFEPLPPEE
jgi:antitoxin (DNA-binding transcriptional repressor) of toxin-antitoxin stability system